MNAYLEKCNSRQQQGKQPGVDSGKEVEAEEADKAGAKVNTIVGRMVTMQGMQVSAAATPAKDTFITAPPQTTVVGRKTTNPNEAIGRGLE